MLSTYGKRKPYGRLALLFLGIPLPAAEWKVRVEEPTGIYRRSDEVVSIPLAQVGGHRDGYRVRSTKDVPWQVSGDSLLFAASVIPGDIGFYTISCCEKSKPLPNQITLREVGMRRVELGNDRFRVVIDRGVPAIIEAYSLTTGPERMLNFVETTPDTPWPNTGWSTLGSGGEFSKVELLETGPIRGRVRLSRPGESWEFTWDAGSAALRWKVRGAKGFRFASASAHPYLPFDRFVDGSEYEWPQGPEEGEPPNHDIGPRVWKKLPGGHAVYYRRTEDYGAFGIVALDPKLDWSGVGTRQFEAAGAGEESEIALTFPRWSKDNTVLEARRENRVLRQPLLVRVVMPVPDRPADAGRRPAPQTLPLDGNWQLAHGDKGAGPQSDWRTVRVPGTVHTQILDPPKFHTREAEWISSQEWWYRRTIRVPADWNDQRVRLEFEATDYYAEVYWNGHYAGRHEGYIDPWECDVGHLLKPGENEVLVRVWTPVSYYWRHRPYTIKGAYGAVDQKPDDITPLGITRSVRLVLGETIGDVAVNTRLTGESADVEVEFSQPGAYELALRPKTFASSDVFRVSGEGSRFVIHVPNPRLWWTWDHGRPNLYSLELKRLDNGATKTLTVGIREIEKIGWTFYLNRRRMFIRGTNYYDNLFMSEMNRAAYQRDMDLMLRMNVNMIRLHCHFSNPEFYDLADERGVLIWQDFLEAWYPHDRDFSVRAAALYDNHIKYVRNHPSVAIWATSDEEDLENYRDLTKHLAPRLFLHDPQRRPVVRSTGRYGDGHIYHGWYEGSIWEYTQMNEAFVSELGATALPNYESVVKFLPNHWPIEKHADDWVFHKLQIPEAMKAWGPPGNLTLEEYIPGTQAYVARLFQIALERMRRRKYDAGGILHFHAIDIWPSVTMAAVDYYRVPTKVFDTVRRSFAPVLASIEYDRDTWRVGEEMRVGIWAINDEWREIPGATIHWRIDGQEAGGQFEAAMAADSARKVGEVYWRAAQPGNFVLRAEVRDARGSHVSENLFEFSIR